MWKWLSRRRRNEDLDAEILAHHAMATRDRIGRGEDPDTARSNARRELGSEALIKETTRDMWGWGAIDRVRQDLVYSARVLRKSPGFSVIAILTMALGIGATTALFSAIEAVLLRPLPYARPEALVWLTRPSPRMSSGAVLTPEFAAWRAESHTFDGLAAWNDESFNLTRAGEPESLVAASVNADFLRVLGIQPILGRDFETSQDRPGNTRFVLLGYRVWQRHFGGDENCIGRVVALNDAPYVVTGVLPRDFRFPGDIRPELLVPGGYSTPPEWKADTMGLLRIIGRPRQGVSYQQIESELGAIERRHVPDVSANFASIIQSSRIQVTPLAQELNGKVRRPLLVLWGAVGMVLLLICANMAGLQLARASARGSELALRAALGAGRGRLARLVLGESLLVACGGGLLGLVGAFWLVRVMRTLQPLRLPDPDAIHVNTAVLVFACAITLIAGVLAGIAPALSASRPDLQSAMKGGSRTLTRGWRGGMRSLLVVSEVAIALVLLLGAGLLLRSVQKLLSVRMGLDSTRVLTLRVPLRSERIRTDERRFAAVRELLDRAHALPGVEQAAVVSSLPLTGYNLGATFQLEGRPTPPGSQAPGAAILAVSSAYFTTLGIPVTAGRRIQDSDREGTARVALVNAAFARQHYPKEDPVGKHIRFGNGDSQPWITIVGVAGDVLHRGPEQPPGPEVFVPFAQQSRPSFVLVVRSAIPPETLASALRREIHALDADLPITDLATMQDRISRATAPQRLQLALVGFFALLATVLAALGVYGVIAYAVSQSTQEIGIRLALGAPPGQVRRSVVARGMALGVAGVALGLAGGYVLTKYLATLLYETNTHDAATFAGASAVLLLMALLASYLPARRASSVDPVAALRG